jgi:hypothetical protein
MLWARSGARVSGRRMAECNQIPRASVVALAGRRIDRSGAQPPRFPLDRVQEVGRRVADALLNVRAVTLICSAACGADLVALEQAERLRLRRRIVLPFAKDRFRNTSVVDRPGDWGPIYDRQIEAAEAAGGLIVLNGAGDDDAAYGVANKVIIREAIALARSAKGGDEDRLIAMLVWEGDARPKGDATASFGTLATEAGFEVRSIPTL